MKDSRFEHAVTKGKAQGSGRDMPHETELGLCMARPMPLWPVRFKRMGTAGEKQSSEQAKSDDLERPQGANEDWWVYYCSEGVAAKESFDR